MRSKVDIAVITIRAQQALLIQENALEILLDD